MVLLLFVCCEVALLVTEPLGRNVPPFVTFSKTNVILSGIIGVLIGPIAEEIFWRGYVVDQLRKFTRSAVAILLQSLLFALPHLGFANSCYAAFQAFLIGIVLGIWRVRFRSLLPLMLAHMIFNGVVVIPRLVELYGIAEVSEPVAEEMAEFARTSARTRSVGRSKRWPENQVPKAVPAIIDFFSDPEQPVRDYAGLILTAHFRHDAEPYLKGTLSSRDRNALDVALFVVGMCRYSGLIEKCETLRGLSTTKRFRYRP